MRYYDIDGKLYPSVTTALSIIRKPALEVWRGRLGNREADRQQQEAADLGSTIHDYCHCINIGLPVDPPEELKLLIDSYRQWFEATVKEVLFSEVVVYSDMYAYAGRLDLVATIKGDRTPSVIDLKTGRVLHGDVALQLSAYQLALEEMGTKTGRRLVAHLNKGNGKLKAGDYMDHDRDLRHFLYTLELWRYFEGGKKIDPGDIIPVRTADFSSGTGS